jgi:hypothetical protein
MWGTAWSWTRLSSALPEAEQATFLLVVRGVQENGTFDSKTVLIDASKH